MSDNQFKEVYLKNYYNIIRNRIKIIIFFIIITFSIVAVRTYTTTPLYQAITEILIEQNHPSSLYRRENRYYAPDQTFLPTQYEIIRSTGVIEKTIEDLELNTKYRAHFLGEETNENPGLKYKIKVSIDAATTKVKDFIKSIIKKSDEDQLSPENKENLKGPEDFAKKIIRRHISKNLEIFPLPETKIVRFIYTDKDPKMAARIANHLVDAYKSELMEIKLDNANYSLKWMKIKADEEVQKLQELESNKQAYAKANDIITIENRLAVLPDKLEQYNARLTEAESRQHQLQEVNKLLQASGGELQHLESIPLIANNPVLRNIQNQLVDLDRSIAELSKKFGPKHPRMIERVHERRILLKEKNNEIKRITQSTSQEYKLAKEAEENINALFQKTKIETLQLNDKLSEYERMNRELETGRTLHEALVKNMKEASARTQEKEVNVWVANEAMPPRYPFKPNKVLNLALALVLGTAGGVGFAFFLEYLDDTIKAPEDIEKFKTPVLGIVEKVASKGNKQDLFINEGSFSTLAESYKIIRSSVLLSSPDTPPHSILITSTEPGDGKTTTTINFSRSLSMLQNSKVIVIDCDLRKPRLHANLKLKYKRGQNLSSYLAGIIPSSDKIILKNVGLPFDIIPAGPVPPNPSELISSTRMQTLLNDLKKKYDYVILDSPPLFGAIDGLNLSTLVEGTILVVRAHKTTGSLYGKVVKRLRSVNSRILGSIINGAEIKKGNLYQYAGYYASYGRYGDAPSENQE